MDFRWEAIEKESSFMKTYLRPLVMALDFTSHTPNNPWIAAVQWFKTLFSDQQTLENQLASACPTGTLPKRLWSYLTMSETEESASPKIQAKRYEFWIYRQLRKRFKAGEIYLDDSVQYRALEDELVSLAEAEQGRFYSSWISSTPPTF